MRVNLIDIRIRKRSIVELCLGLIFVLPYAETGGIRKTLEYFNDRIYIHPMIFIMLTLLVISCGLMLRVKTNNKGKRLGNYFYGFFLMAFIIGFPSSIFNNAIDIFIVQYLWCIIPFLYARTMVNLVDKYRLSYKNILKNGLFLFTIFCVFSLVYSMLKFGFAVGSTVRLTGGSGGGGSVIFGYTIVLFFGLLITLRKHLKAANVLLYGLILISTSILTQSRGAIWMILLMIIPFALGNKKVLTKLFIMISGALVIIFLDPFNLIYEYAPRAFKIEDSARTLTWINTLKIYINQPLLSIFLGTGIGQFFPYQSWVISQRSFESFFNIFYFNGASLLVQPHNTFIYLLIETGFIGLSLFVLGFIRIFRYLYYKAKKFNYAYAIVGVLIYLNLFDSVFLILPGISGVWWLVLFFIIGYVDQETRNSNLDTSDLERI
jgi:O-antigen ligase